MANEDVVAVARRSPPLLGISKSRALIRRSRRRQRNGERWRSRRLEREREGERG